MRPLLKFIAITAPTHASATIYQQAVPRPFRAVQTLGDAIHTPVIARLGRLFDGLAHGELSA